MANATAVYVLEVHLCWCILVIWHMHQQVHSKKACLQHEQAAERSSDYHQHIFRRCFFFKKNDDRSFVCKCTYYNKIMFCLTYHYSHYLTCFRNAGEMQLRQCASESIHQARERRYTISPSCISNAQDLVVHRVSWHQRATVTLPVCPRPVLEAV